MTRSGLSRPRLLELGGSSTGCSASTQSSVNRRWQPSWPVWGLPKSARWCERSFSSNAALTGAYGVPACTEEGETRCFTVAVASGSLVLDVTIVEDAATTNVTAVKEQAAAVDVLALSEQLNVSGLDLTLEGLDGEQGATIDAEGLSRAIDVSGGGQLTLRRVHVVNGNATSGGGLLVQGAGSALLMEQASVRDCVATGPTSFVHGGGGLACQHRTPGPRTQASVPRPLP